MPLNKNACPGGGPLTVSIPPGCPPVARPLGLLYRRAQAIRPTPSLPLMSTQEAHWSRTLWPWGQFNFNLNLEAIAAPPLVLIPFWDSPNGPHRLIALVAERIGRGGKG